MNCLLADRVLVGDKWIKFLNDNVIPYHIWIRDHVKVYSYQKQADNDSLHVTMMLFVEY